MKELITTLYNRWKAKTPIIFKRIIKLSIGISTVALAIHSAITSLGLEVPEWWLDVLPYLVGAGAGAGAVAKLTQQYDEDGNPMQNKD